MKNENLKHFMTVQLVLSAEIHMLKIETMGYLVHLINRGYYTLLYDIE